MKPAIPSTTIIIPARYHSSRFEGKPLVKICNKTLLERVWLIACKSQLADQVFIATDHSSIFEHAQSLSAQVLMTPPCKTGSERVAHAANQLGLTEDAIVLSLQGDALLTPPWVIDALIKAMQDNPDYLITTPAVELVGKDFEDFLQHKALSPSSGTTVTFSQSGKALYFSKQIIPSVHSSMQVLYRHIGLYAYRQATLQHLTQLAVSRLEAQESLEQLRALENDMPIQVIVVDYRQRTHGSIDTPSDIAFVENIIRTQGELF